MLKKSIVHRDLKPQNILLMNETAAVPVIKVADFGFARFVNAVELAETGCGTPLYMVCRRRGDLAGRRPARRARLAHRRPVLQATCARAMWRAARSGPRGRQGATVRLQSGHVEFRLHPVRDAVRTPAVHCADTGPPVCDHRADDRREAAYIAGCIKGRTSTTFVFLRPPTSCTWSHGACGPVAGRGERGRRGGQDLVLKLLRKDALARIGTEELLLQPFLRGIAPDTLGLSYESPWGPHGCCRVAAGPFSS